MGGRVGAKAQGFLTESQSLLCSKDVDWDRKEHILLNNKKETVFKIRACQMAFLGQSKTQNPVAGGGRDSAASHRLSLV